MFQPQTGSFGYLAIATFIACFDLLTVFQPQTGSFGYLAKFLLVSYRHYFSVSTPNGFLRLFSQKWCLSIQVKVLTFQPQTGSFGYLAVVNQGIHPARLIVSTPNGFLRLFSHLRYIS